MTDKSTARMPLVTSVIFKPSFAAYLSPSSLSHLMRVYFSTSRTRYISRTGRSAILRVRDGSTTGTWGFPRSCGSWNIRHDAPVPERGALVHTEYPAAPRRPCLLPRCRARWCTSPGFFARRLRARSRALRSPGLREQNSCTLFVRVSLGWVREGQADAGWDRRRFFSAWSWTSMIAVDE